MAGRTLMMHGNSACAEGAILAGCRFFAGYPITPSSEIAEYLSARLPAMGGTFIQMEDEIASIGAVIGASIGGVKAMTATSGPGFSLMQENIGLAAMTEIPCVVVNVQRGGPSTGLPTLPSQMDVMQSRWGAHGEHPIIVLTPSSASETLFLTIRAFNLAEKYRTPVILLTDEITAHLTEKVTIPEPESIQIIDREKPTVPPEEYLPYQMVESDIPPMANFGEGYRYHITGLAHDETGFPTNDSVKVDEQLRRLNRKIERYHDEIVELDTYWHEDMEIAVVCYGAPFRSALNAVRRARKDGTKAGILKLKTIWPFPDKELRELLQDVEKIVVPELNLGQVAFLLKCIAGDSAPIRKVNKINGEPITPDEIFEAIKEER